MKKLFYACATLFCPAPGASALILPDPPKPIVIK